MTGGKLEICSYENLTSLWKRGHALRLPNGIAARQTLRLNSQENGNKEEKHTRMNVGLFLSTSKCLVNVKFKFYSITTCYVPQSDIKPDCMSSIVTMFVNLLTGNFSTILFACSSSFAPL